MMKQSPRTHAVSFVTPDQLEKIATTLPPKDIARIQRNINNDWLKICIRLVSAKRKNEQAQ